MDVLPADLLDPRPWQVPDLLLEAEDYSADARVFVDADHQRAFWEAWVLALNGKPMNLPKLRRLLDREELLRALAPHHDRDERNRDWLIVSTTSGAVLRIAAPAASIGRWVRCSSSNRPYRRCGMGQPQIQNLGVDNVVQPWSGSAARPGARSDRQLPRGSGTVSLLM